MLRIAALSKLWAVEWLRVCDLARSGSATHTLIVIASQNVLVPGRSLKFQTRTGNQIAWLLIMDKLIN